MNLVQDAWLPLLLRDGSVKTMPPSAIVMNDVVDIALPRADFQGAAYQFLIGILQTLMAPEDRKEWRRAFKNPPSQESFQAQLDKVAHAFNLLGDGPLFMQDFDSLDEAKSSTVSGLLIEAPGENGIKNNTDHFIKRGVGGVMSLPMAALALFTLQINAPSGGQGHRVGLRGGGPLTTLLLPQDEASSLWQKVMLNVINREFWQYDDPDLSSVSVFPWLGSTKVSNKAGTELYAAEVHPLHMFWAMPRRVRLEEKSEEGVCGILGGATDSIVKSYRTQNYGNNYSGAWRHPLTAYREDPKKPEDVPNSAKAQPGGLTYKYWDALTFTDKSIGQQSAMVVDHFYYISNGREDEFGEMPRVWSFGFDMDNMKARGWYETTMPLFSINFERQADFLRTVKDLQELINKARLEVRKHILEAWFERPGDAKGDTSFIQAEFWQRTESIFFETVHHLSRQENYSFLETKTAEKWLFNVRQIIINLFDEYTLTVDIGDTRSMKRCMKARRFLTGWLYGSKDIKKYKEQHKIPTNKEIAS